MIMIEILAVCLLGISLSLGVLVIAVSKEHPKRSGKRLKSQAIRDRHLEEIRPQNRKLSNIDEREASVIDTNQIIV